MKKVTLPSRLVHGHTSGGKPSRTYVSYQQMLQRVYNPKATDYQHYGGRGIEVCDRWRHSFENFLADMGERPLRHSLDRIDNSGNYCKSNCRWASPESQGRNKRTSRMLTHDGVTRSLPEWAEIVGIYVDTIRDRLDKSGWSVQMALTTPVRKWRRKGDKTSGGE